MTKRLSSPTKTRRASAQLDRRYRIQAAREEELRGRREPGPASRTRHQRDPRSQAQGPRAPDSQRQDPGDDFHQDPNLFAPWFKDPETWAAWDTFLRTLFALPLDANQFETYKIKPCTGRNSPPIQHHSEAWLVCGRRGRKSFTLALIAVFLSTFNDYRKYLAPGEKATVLIIATDSKQSRVIFRYLNSSTIQRPPGSLPGVLFS
jgi:hypothetical protein